MSSSVRVRYDASVDGEVTTFDDDGVPTEIVNPLEVTIRSLANWAEAGFFEFIIWEVIPK